MHPPQTHTHTLHILLPILAPVSASAPPLTHPAALIFNCIPFLAPSVLFSSNFGAVPPAFSLAVQFPSSFRAVLSVWSWWCENSFRAVLEQLQCQFRAIPVQLSNDLRANFQCDSKQFKSSFSAIQEQFQYHFRAILVQLPSDPRSVPWPWCSKNNLRTTTN